MLGKSTTPSSKASRASSASKPPSKSHQSSLLSFFGKTCAAPSSITANAPTATTSANKPDVILTPSAAGFFSSKAAVMSNTHASLSDAKSTPVAQKCSTPIQHTTSSTPCSIAKPAPMTADGDPFSAQKSTHAFHAELDEESDEERMPSTARKGSFQKRSLIVSDDEYNDDEDAATEFHQQAMILDGSDPEQHPLPPHHQTPCARRKSLSESFGLSSATKTPSRFSLVGGSTTTPHSSTTPMTPALNTGSNYKRPRLGEATPVSAKSGKKETRYAWLAQPRDASKRTPDDPAYDPRTLFIPPSAWNAFTPFERQFWEIKCKHWDTVVFFKKGSFYELYEKDADIGHQKFDLKMVDRVNMRMVGVPESSFDHWVSQFIAKGFKVAQVDQLENSVSKAIRDRDESGQKGKKGTPGGGASSQIIRRELTSILTAGTLVSPGLLTSDAATYCLAIKCMLSDGSIDHSITGTGGEPTFGICFADTATGELKACSFIDDVNCTKLETILLQIKPKELVLERGRLPKAATKIIKNALADPIVNQLMPDLEFWTAERTTTELKDLEYPDSFFASSTSSRGGEGPGLFTRPVVLSAIGGLLYYLRSLKLDKPIFQSARRIEEYSLKGLQSLVLDGQTLLNLDIFENSVDGSENGSLFKLLNHCSTPFGKRLYKKWVCHPLCSVDPILERLDAVDAFNSHGSLCVALKEILRKLPDLERMISRIHGGSSKVKEFVITLQAFHTILSRIFGDDEEGGEGGKFRTSFGSSSAYLARLFGGTSSTRVNDGDLETTLAPLQASLNFFHGAFDYSQALSDNTIQPKAGFDAEYDAADTAMNAILAEFDEHLQKAQKELRCKLSYRDIGKELFQIEVPGPKTKVPSNWTVMSKTQSVTRYWNPAIQSLVKSFLEAREIRDSAMDTLRYRYYARFDQHYMSWLSLIKRLAELDCLLSLANCSASLSEPCCRPDFVHAPENRAGGVLELRNLRHPCVMSKAGSDFIPNDTCLGGDDTGRMILLTGPNMGGKSTLLRQTCLAVIMAQLGCYVPASTCRLSPVDRIFTRIGANDNILAGQSTFMVELSETSKILSEATPRSLVILDELGRGTSTFDGYAIAAAVLHFLCTHVHCLGLFSTHYGMLPAEFQDNPLVKLMYTSYAYDEEAKRVTFLYKLTDGHCPNSYGMNVGTLAGIPSSIIDCATRIAGEFECKTHQGKRSRALGVDEGTDNEEGSLSMLRLADFVSLVSNSGCVDSNVNGKSPAEDVLRSVWRSLQPLAKV